VDVLAERTATHTPSLYRMLRALESTGIAVDPRFRRRGVGRALILKAIAEAKTLGIPNIEVQSWAFNQETHACSAMSDSFQRRSA
jgi:GNAT superfamily N-acetyltransferase